MAKRHQVTRLVSLYLAKELNFFFEPPGIMDVVHNKFQIEFIYQKNEF